MRLVEWVVIVAHGAVGGAFGEVAAVMQIGHQIGLAPAADTIGFIRGDIRGVIGIDGRASQPGAGFHGGKDVARRVAFGTMSKSFSKIGAVLHVIVPVRVHTHGAGTEEENTPA